jgi:hypothetical protein
MAYFFSRLQNPEWIEPLSERGFFASPPPPKRQDEEGTISFPMWPQSQYLARMAAQRPEAVRAAIEQIPQTENFRIHEDYLNAAVVMPPAIAASLAARAVEFLRAPYGSHLADAVAHLVAHLGTVGTCAEALVLAAALLEVQPDPEAEEKRLQREEGILGASLEPQAHCVWWRLKRFFNEVVPLLVRTAPIETISVLAAALDHVVELSTFTERPLDLSGIWRPAIEEHPQNWSDNLKTALLSALRTACEQAVETDATMLAAVEAALRTHSWHLFERLILHLYRKFPVAAGTRIPQSLTDRRCFGAPDLHHEYTLLLQEHFAKLAQVQQEIILGWINAGPELTEGDEESTSTANREEYGRYWRLRQLRPIRDALPPEWAERYRGLWAELGEPEADDTLIFRRDMTERKESPKTLDELRALSPGEIIDFMRNWQPGSDFFDPSPDGLARSFQSLVAERATLYSAEAESFEQAEPVYVRALLSGLSEAAQKGETLNWPPVLRLGEWILEQPADRSERRRGSRAIERRDFDWRSTRRELPRLLRAALREDKAGLGIEARDAIWTLLRILLDDPEPTLDYERGSGMDLVMLSINTVRGETMHALVDYALWLRRKLTQDDLPAPDFTAMPEVRELLDAHLDLDREPSTAVRTIYGHHFPWLHLLDEKWASANLRRIFPENNAIGVATWAAYIVFNTSYDDLLPLLDAEYRRAITRLATPTSDERLFGRPDENLADHLMGFYWRGQLDFTNPHGLLRAFYEVASDQLRAHALAGIGHALSASRVPLAGDELTRLTALWEWRCEVAAARGQRDLFEKELAAFAWWFESGKFPSDWSLSNMARALDLSDSVELETLISERLLSLAPINPVGTLKVLRLLVAKLGRTSGWLFSTRDTAATLEQAVKHDGPEALRLAREIRDMLLSFGFFEFRTVALA